MKWSIRSPLGTKETHLAIELHCRKDGCLSAQPPLGSLVGKSSTVLLIAGAKMVLHSDWSEGVVLLTSQLPLHYKISNWSSLRAPSKLLDFIISDLENVRIWQHYALRTRLQFQSIMKWQIWHTTLAVQTFCMWTISTSSKYTDIWQGFRWARPHIRH